MLPTEKDEELLKFLVLFIQTSNINFILSNIFFFVFLIKFRKTKQIVVALIAATLKALLSVAKTNGRLSGRNSIPLISITFFEIFLLIYPPISI